MVYKEKKIRWKAADRRHVRKGSLCTIVHKMYNIFYHKDMFKKFLLLI